MKKQDLAQERAIELAIVTIASFVTGIVVGLLFSPRSGRENRAWINDQVDHLGDWVSETGQKTVFRANKELDELRSKVKKGIDKAVPNLYKATEKLEIDEAELLRK
jgi:gas vesicle protein